MRASFVFSALVVTAIAAAYGCTLPLQGLSADGSGGVGGSNATSTTIATSAGGAPTTTTTGSTTSATGTTSSGPTSSASTGPAECATDISCGTNSACVTYTCVMGKCMKAILNEGMKVGTDTAGDCKQTLCMGGAATTVPDLGDFIEDGNPCTIDGCDENGPVAPTAPNGDICGSPAQHCFQGMCKECGDASQCPGGGDPSCSFATCDNGLCGVSFKGDGTGCANGSQCKDAGTCAGGVCVQKNKSNGTSCDGIFSCTSGDCCLLVVCGNGSVCCGLGQICNPGQQCKP